MTKRRAKKNAIVIVQQLGGKERSYTYVGLTPRQAVVAAYAQEKGDMNTWDYKKKYDHLVREGKYTVFIAVGEITMTAIKRAALVSLRSKNIPKVTS